MLEEGGCNKWFNELNLKQEIEARLSKGSSDAKKSKKIPWMDPSNVLKGREHVHKMLGVTKVAYVNLLLF